MLAVTDARIRVTVVRRLRAAGCVFAVDEARLLIETSERQAPVTAAIVRAGGLEERIVRSEEADSTIVIGRT